MGIWMQGTVRSATQDVIARLGNIVALRAVRVVDPACAGIPIRMLRRTRMVWCCPVVALTEPYWSYCA